MRTNRDGVSSETNHDWVGVLHECQAESVGVVRAAGEYCLVATRPVAAGERLFECQGETTDRPSRYSMQIGEDLHIDVGSGHGAEEILDRYFWCYLNHSCDPNALVRGREVIACRDINPWEAVRFNYNTTEWDLAEPFSCDCGSPNCLGRIQGFRHLTPTQRERLRMAAPHFSRLVLEESQD